MKKNIAISIVIFLISVITIIVSCKKQVSETTVISETEIENPFNFVGEMHNIGLDFVLGTVTKTKSATVSEKEIEKITNIFCKKVFLEDERFFENTVTKSGDYYTSKNNIEDKEVILSEKVTKYCDKIITVSQTNDYEYIKEQYSLFEKDLLGHNSYNFSEYEKSLLLCSIAVGKYSNEYWKENLISTKSAFGNIVGADLGGALIGMKRRAIEIVICGAIGGVGCGLAAAGRAALGPAVAASALEGLAEGCGALF